MEGFDVSSFIQTIGKAVINYHQFHSLQEGSHFVRPETLKK